MTFCPAEGDCATITLEGDGCAGGPEFAAPFSSAGISTIDATLTFPRRNPASDSARLTLPNGCPTKLGITNICCAAALVTNRLIFGAINWLAFAVGFCASTWSAGTPAVG